MNREDHSLLASIQDGIPLTEAPFRDAGAIAGMSEGDVIDSLGRLVGEGTIRRFGARIDHRKLGILANAMVCWGVPAYRIEDVGRVVAGFPGVTHCYEREIIAGVWEYNFFCVIHGRTKEEVHQVIKDIEEKTGIDGHVALFSRKKFKHTPAVILKEADP
jgi:DNA-binding Lrp family transcriptional regulator